MSTALASGHKVTIEDVGPSRKKLTFTISGKAANEAFETQMATLAVEAQLPGFRPGRVPRRLIEKKFGDAVRNEAKNQLIASAYSEAIEHHKLAVLGEPEGNDELAKLRFEGTKDATFSLEVEVAPEFDLPKVDDIEVLKPVFTVKDEQIEEQVTRLRVNEGELENQQTSSPGDYCIGRGIMKDSSGKVLLDLEGAVIQLPEKDKGPKGAILGILVDDFAKQAGLPKPGDTITVKAKGPEGHERPDVRGQALDISFKIERVERIIPAKIDTLLAKYGMTDEAQLRDQLRDRLTQRGMIEQQSAMRQQLAKKLLESVKFELPKNLTQRQSERNLSRTRMELAYRGMEPMEIESRIAELRNQSNEQAVNELKLFFVMNKAAADLNVQVTEDEVNGRIVQIAMERRVRPDKLRAELIQNGQVQMLVQQVREHKAMDALLAKTKAKEISADEFNKLAEAGKI